METLARRYFVKQRFKWEANHYDVFAGEDDTAPHVAFAKQKGLKLKEEVTFWRDDTETELLFSFQATKKLDVDGQNIISDGDGTHLGHVRKDFKSSLRQSKWTLFDEHDRELCIMKERSATLALARRLWQFVPLLGDFPLFGRMHFDYIDSSGEVIGRSPGDGRSSTGTTQSSPTKQLTCWTRGSALPRS